MTDNDPSAPEPNDGGPEADVDTNENEKAYWSEKYQATLDIDDDLVRCVFGAGILFRGFLDQFSLGGYPLGFWFAQQGSIYVFLLLIFYYAWKMKKIEKKYDLDD